MSRGLVTVRLKASEVRIFSGWSADALEGKLQNGI